MDQNELLNTYYRKIYKLALYQLQDIQEAEDITHDVFFKVLNSLDKFEDRSEIYTWIYRIALNTIRNHLRRKKIVRFISLDTQPLENAGLVMTTAVDPAERSEEEEESKRKMTELEAAMKMLTQRERTAFYFFHFEKMKQKEIAQVMQSSVSAVESLVYKGMKKIKRELA